MIYIRTFFIALFLSLLLSPITIKISERLGIFSRTKDGKEKGKPCIGGIAIWTAFLVACSPIWFLYHANRPEFIGLGITSALIMLLGLIDDINDLEPFVKIIVEFAAICILVLFGIVTKISFLPMWANILITFVWILFIMNAFNLLDIADGLTSGLVIIISLTLLVISVVNRDIVSGVILTALIGAHLGFLRFNYPPAMLYMGDTGSLVSGFLLAVVAIKISYAPYDRPVALITPLLAMSLPIYDTLFLIMVRMKKGKSIFRKTNDHFALRLVKMGYSVRKSIWAMYLFSLFLAVSSLLVAFGSNISGIIVLIIVLLVFIRVAKRVGVVRVEDN